MQEIILKDICLNILYIGKQFLGLLGPFVFQFQPCIISLGYLFAKVEGEVQEGNHGENARYEVVAYVVVHDPDGQDQLHRGVYG